MESKSKVFVKLPCEVGISVWVLMQLTPRTYELIECNVESFTISDSMKAYAVLKRIRTKGFESVFTVAVEDFGKLVFLRATDYFIDSKFT